MNNPLIIPILGYLRERNIACSLIDLVKLCEQNLLIIVGRDVDPQVAIFQKNFFVMNALYQIQEDILSEGFLLEIFPLDISIVPSFDGGQGELTTRDINLARYYLDWSNLNSITVEDIETLFSQFWQEYRAVDSIDAALTTLGLDKNVGWLDIRQAYKKKITTCHPDKGGRADDFIEIRKAYEILSLSYH
jgi:hypothetical protein